MFPLAVPDKEIIVGTSMEISDFQRQINDIKLTLKEGFEDLKKMLQDFDKRVRAVETNHSTCQVDLAAKIEAVRVQTLRNETKIKELEEDQERHQERLQKLESTNNILKWILTILTAIITALSVAVVFAVIRMIQGAI